MLTSLVVLAALGLSPREAVSQSAGGLEFADWTQASSGTSAAGTLRGSSISLSGDNVGTASSGSTVDGSSPIFNQAFFSPALAATDAITFTGDTGHSYTLQFGAPARNPVLHIASLASTLTFPTGTQITRVSGDSKFSVTGNSVVGQLDGTSDANGTVRLSGTFSSLTFSATPVYPPGSGDGIYLQVGTPLPVAAGPPPPTISDIRPARPFSPGTPGVITAPTGGGFDTIRWDFKGDSRPEVVSLPGQTGVRFRPPSGRFVVRATPVGPGGVGATSTQTLDGPAKLQNRTAARIQARAAKLTPVYATGAPDALVNGGRVRTSCARAAPLVMRSGAVEVKGCLRPIESISDIPLAELGVVDPLSHLIDSTIEYGSCGGCPPSKGEVPRKPLEQGVSLLDGYIANGPVTLNGVTLDPAAGRSVVVYPQADYIASSNARIKAGDIELAHRASFQIDTKARGGRIPLGPFGLEKGPRDGLGGFPLYGDVDVSLLAPTAGAAAQGVVKPNVVLPRWLTDLGSLIPRKVEVRAVNGHLVLDRLKVGPIDASIGEVGVKAFQIDYAGGNSKEWRGQAKVCVVGGCRVDMTPPNGGVVVRDSQLAEAGARVSFDPGIVLFPSVTLDFIQFKVALDPTRLSGKVGITAAGAIDLTGDAVVAFPSARTPYVFEGIPGFPKHFDGRRHTRGTVAASAEAAVKTPIGRIGLGNSYFLYEFPGEKNGAGYVAFGGGVKKNLLDVVEFDGRFDGEFNTGNGRYRLGGKQEACLHLIKKTLGVDIAPCVGVVGVISNRGFGACSTGFLSIGGGYLYGDGVTVWPFRGCKWSPFDEKNVKGSRTAQAGGAYTVRIRRGDPGRAIRFDGAGGAPRVRITGPGGQALEAPSDAGVVARGALKIVRTQEKFGITVAGISAPGTYRIETLPGSSPVRKVTEANDQPSAKVRARVRGRGSRRVLTYSIRRRRAQRVTFSEVQPGGGTRTIGTKSGGGRGSVRFSPAPGRGSRRIEAQFELAGMPAEKLTIARFRPPSPTIGRPRRLRVRRKATRLRVSWRKVRGAARYEVFIAKSNGTVRRRRTRRAGLVLRGVSRSTSGRVSVRAVAGGVKGRTAVRRYRATAALKNRVRALPRCRGGKTKIVCRRAKRR